MPNNEDNNANNNNNVDKKPKEKDEAPVPETVQVGGSPVYKMDKKLGKGGFGQVCGLKCKAGEGNGLLSWLCPPTRVLVPLSLAHRLLFSFSAGVLGQPGPRHEGQGGTKREPGGLEARAPE